MGADNRLRVLEENWATEIVGDADAVLDRQVVSVGEGTDQK